MIQDVSLMFSVRQAVAAAGVLAHVVDLGLSQRSLGPLPAYFFIHAETGNPTGYTAVLQGSNTVDGAGALTSAVTITTIVMPATAGQPINYVGMPDTNYRYIGAAITGIGAATTITAGLSPTQPPTMRTYNDAIARIT